MSDEYTVREFIENHYIIDGNKHQFFKDKVKECSEWEGLYQELASMIEQHEDGAASCKLENATHAELIEKLDVVFQIVKDI